LKGRERMGSSLPPTELARRDSALLRKWNAYFLLRWWEVWRSLKHSPDVAPDAEPMRPVCCQCLALLGLGTGR